MSATGARLAPGTMQFAPPTLDGITRKRPCTDVPLMPSVPEAQVCVWAPSPCSAQSKPPSPNRSDPYCPAELDEIGRLMGVARSRHINLVNRYAALCHDATALQGRLGETQVALENERASTGRAYVSITELQSWGSRLVERVRELRNLREAIAQKRSSIDELIHSMQEVKKRSTAEHQRLAAENARLSSELGSERKENGELVNGLRESVMELEKAKEALERELRASEDGRNRLQESLHALNGAHQREKEDLEGSMAQTRDELCKRDLWWQEYKRDMCGTILMLTKRLGCRPPASFGDGGSKALGVVIDECIAEHSAVVDGKEQEQLVLVEALRSEGIQAKAKIKKLEEELLSRLSAEEAKDQATAAELAKREQYIQKLENRIAGMQLEAAGNASKLAELQKLRVVYQVVQESIFQGQDINDTEYADLHSLIAEELSHSGCNSKLQEAEARAARRGTECEHLRSQLQAIKKEAQACGKVLQDKSTALVAQSDAQNNAARSAAVGSKDKTVVEGLIRLIENDTSELKAISVRKTISSPNPTPPQPTRRGRSAGRTNSSAHKPSKRTPLPSSQSEVDLWSMFAGKKSA